MGPYTRIYIRIISEEIFDFFNTETCQGDQGKCDKCLQLRKIQISPDSYYEYVIFFYNMILTEQSHLFSKDRVSRQVAQMYKLQMQSPKFCQNAASARGPWPISTDSTMIGGRERQKIIMSIYKAMLMKYNRQQLYHYHEKIINLQCT